MYSPYRGRSHTKKQHNNCKLKLSVVEKKKRKQTKLFAKQFPQWLHFNPCISSKQIKHKDYAISPAGGDRIHNSKKISTGGGFDSRLLTQDSRL
jgi:hypothetical protein